MLQNPFIPNRVKAGLTAKQAEFLMCPAAEVLFGGAAGGGKSTALLCAALQLATYPGFHALILRRTYKQLAKADSILGKAKEWLLPLGVDHVSADHLFKFPSGATLEFGHMDHDDAKHNYQGGAWHFIGVDEATQFTPEMLAYPRTRQRREVDCPFPIVWRCASNPGGIGHDYIKARFIKDGEGQPINNPDRRFFPATINDNPNLDRDEYIRTLQESGVDPLTLAQLLKGDWDAVPGGRFKMGWLQSYFRRGDYAICRGNDYREGFDKLCVPSQCERFLTVDTAASLKTTADWTVISVWAVTPWNDLLWLDCIRFRCEIPDIVPRIEQAWHRYKPRLVGIEAVMGNQAVFQAAMRTKMNVTRLEPRIGGRMVDKLVHATPAISFAACGRLWLPLDNPGFPLDHVVSELTRFTGNEKEDDHDDIVDTLSMAVQLLTQGRSEQPGRPLVMGGAT